MYSFNKLEYLSNCPVCSSDNIDIFLDNVEDVAFRAVSGKWSIYRCVQCKSGFLNPRPTEEDIGFAYENYYTHEKEVRQKIKEGVVRKIKNLISSGYKDYRFRNIKNIRTVYFYLIFSCFKKNVIYLDYEYRHIPPLFKNARILDVGCGNGEFLKKAKDLGWTVNGVDFDAEAVALARKEGIEVFHGSLKDANFEKNSIDIITLSHVIEHIHNPKDFLKSCYDILKPGGVLWIDTPNFESLGLSIFKEYWRGLEPPRHLVLFNERSLKALSEDTGFSSISSLPYRELCLPMFSASEGLMNGEKSNFRYPISNEIKKKIISAEKKLLKNSSQREFLSFRLIK